MVGYQAPSCPALGPHAGERRHYAGNRCGSTQTVLSPGIRRLFVRKPMQHLKDRIAWDVAAVEKLAALSPNEARAPIKALEAEGLVERNQGIEGGGWSITQRGRSFGSATAAKPITRRREPWLSSRMTPRSSITST